MSSTSAAAAVSSSSKSAWASNATIDQVAQTLRGARSVVITTHAKPDGDAVGSTIALARSLMRVGVSVEVWFIGPVARWVEGLCKGVTVREFAPGQPLQPVGFAWSAPNPDISVVVDTGTWNQVAELKPWLAARADRTINIDHHLHGEPALSSLRIVETACASCTQALAPLCTRLLGLPGAANLPLEIAEPIYLGLATDTGWLRYSNVTHHTLRLAADLFEAGVDHTRLYRIIEQQDQPSRWKLFGRALTSLKLDADGRIATMALTLKDFSECGADATETSGFADMTLAIASVEAAAVLTETAVSAGEPPLTKISFRSKPGPSAIDVNAVANQIGGGGHARAAGAKTRTDIDAARRTVIDALEKAHA